MKFFIFKVICVVLVICLSGCSNKGSPAPAPTNVKFVAGDSGATVTWDMVPGVQYFVYWAPVTSLTTASCDSTPTCLAATSVSSPYVISNLVNGTTYSVTVNGRINGGPGGPGSPSLSVTPRTAAVGGTWTSSSTSSSTLRGVIAGTGITGTGVQYIAVGDSGALYSGTVNTTTLAMNWSALSNPAPSVGLNAVTDSGSVYVAAGAGGEILYSPDYAVTWTAQTSGTGYNLNALYGSAGLYIAAGDSGTILTSGNGVNWSTQTSGTGSKLHGVTYGVANGVGYYVAIGDGGTLLTSPNAVNWYASTSAAIVAGDNYKSVAYGTVQTAGNSFPVAGTQVVISIPVSTGGTVAVYATQVFVIAGGDASGNGVVLYSTDGINWYRTSAGGTATLNSVTFGDQFIAVDSGGNIFTSPTGETWGSTPVQTATAGLNAIAPTITPSVTYTAVGAGGLTMYAQ
jgi:hypothetical protein